MPLLWALRDKLNLVGTKYGCGIGICGSCTVLVNGAPVQSCNIKASALEGKEITTIEGLSPDGSHPVQRAWNDEDVPQCGYCQAGQILAASALLESQSAAHRRRHRRGHGRHSVPLRHLPAHPQGHQAGRRLQDRAGRRVVTQTKASQTSGRRPWIAAPFCRSRCWPPAPC